ncbi:MAG: glycosyltransferase [Candidatus Moraniibacteriota bacterium]
MDLWLIKLGKAWSALKEEGLWRGGTRITKSFFNLFHHVGSGDVLFITGGLGDSARYRSWHVVEELRLQAGLRCSITVQDNPFLSGYADKFSIFIFHRVMYTPSVAKLIEKIKAQHKTIIFETDDLVFDAKYQKDMDHFRKMNTFERKQYAGGVGAEILADPYVEVATTSTDFLAEKLREQNKTVFVVPNKLSQEDVQTMDEILAATKGAAGRDARSCISTESENDVIIGYFSGAKGHDKDFAVVTDVLLELFQKYPQLRLFVAGPLVLDERLLALNKSVSGVETQDLASQEKRIIQVAYVPRAEHFANVAHIDINVAPLEVGNPFCESKSELKFFEAGYLGVPTVASATDPFRRAIEDGVDGFVAMKSDEWKEKLSRLIEDKNLRSQMGERAHEKAVTKYTTTNAHNEEYYAFLKSKIISA